MLYAVDADLLAAAFDGEVRAALDADEVAVVAAGGKTVGEVQADARCRGVGFDDMVDDAKAVLGEDLLVGGSDGGLLPQRQAGAIGADRLLPFIAVGKRPAEIFERPRALFSRDSVKIRVDRAGGAVIGKLLPHFPVVARCVHRRVGEGYPEIEVVGLELQRIGVVRKRAEDVAAFLRGFGRGDRARGVGVGCRRVGETADEAPRLIDVGLVEEAELAHTLGSDIGALLGGGGDDAAGDRALDGAELADIALQEAPARRGVVGEGLALIVALTGGLALVEIDLFADVVVGAEIVGAFGHDEASFLRESRRGKKENGKESKEQRKSADGPSHRSLPGAHPLAAEPTGSPRPRKAAGRRIFAGAVT